MSPIDVFPYLAQESHGPGQHGPLLVIVVLIAGVGGLGYALVRVVGKRRARRLGAHPGPQEDGDLQ